MIWQRDPGDEDDAPLKALERELAQVLEAAEPEIRQTILSRGWPVWLAKFYGSRKL